MILAPNSRYTSDIHWFIKRRSMSGWSSAGVSETVMNPRSGQIYSLDPLRAFRERTTEKVSFSICLSKFNLVPRFSLLAVDLSGSVGTGRRETWERGCNKFWFFENVALISFNLKYYTLFRVSFLYEVVFHYIRAKLSRLSLQYLNLIYNKVAYLLDFRTISWWLLSEKEKSKRDTWRHRSSWDRTLHRITTTWVTADGFGRVPALYLYTELINSRCT